MPFTDYLNGALLSHVFVQDTALTPPAALYVAAYVDAPSDLGTDGTEASGGSYARVAMTWEFSATPGKITNVTAMTMSDMPACTVVALAVFDASSAGNMLAYGVLDDPVTLADGDPLNVPIGLLGIIL